MDYAFTRSGNIVAKDANIEGATYVVNQGKSYIGHCASIRGDRNNGKPIISWGQYVILGDRCSLIPSERSEKFYPMIIGHHVHIGKNSSIQAASIGSNVIIGDDCSIGQFAILKDCVVIPDKSTVPPYAVVGPMSKYVQGEIIETLPESAENAISEYCETTFQGIRVDVPEF